VIHHLRDPEDIRPFRLVCDEEQIQRTERAPLGRYCAVEVQQPRRRELNEPQNDAERATDEKSGCKNRLGDDQ
jgi:hypothetical protein